MKKPIVFVLLALAGCGGAVFGAAHSSANATPGIQALQFVSVPSRLWVADGNTASAANSHSLNVSNGGRATDAGHAAAVALHTSDEYRRCIRRSPPAQTADEAVAVSTGCQLNTAPRHQETVQR
jgi:hypothetical protein